MKNLNHLNKKPFYETCLHLLLLTLICTKALATRMPLSGSGPLSRTLPQFKFGAILGEDALALDIQPLFVTKTTPETEKNRLDTNRLNTRQRNLAPTCIVQLKNNQAGNDESCGLVSDSCEMSIDQAKNLKAEQMLAKIAKTAAIEDDQEAVELITKIIKPAKLEMLQEIMQKESSSARVFTAIARHPLTDTVMLNFLAKSNSVSTETLMAVLVHEQTDTLVLQEVIKNPRATAPVLIVAARHLLINRPILASIIVADESCDEVLAVVAQNDWCTLDMLQNIVLSEKAGVRACKAVVCRLQSKYYSQMNLRNYQVENICKLCIAKGYEENDVQLLMRAIEVRAIEPAAIDAVVQRSTDTNLFYSAALNPVTHAQTSAYIMKNPHTDLKTFCAVIKQPNTTAEMLDDAFENELSDDPYVLEYIADNPQTSTATLNKILVKVLGNNYTTKYQILAAIAQNPNADEELLNTIIQNIAPIKCDLYIMSKLPDPKTITALLAKNPNAKYIVIKDAIDAIYVIENQDLIQLSGGNWLKNLIHRAVTNNLTFMHLTDKEKAMITAKTAYSTSPNACFCLAVVKNPRATASILHFIATITPEEYFDVFAHIAIHENIDGELLKQVLGKIGSSDAFAFDLTKFTARLDNNQFSILLNRLINLYAINQKRLRQVFTRSPIQYVLSMSHLDANKKSSIIVRLSRNDILLQMMHEEGKRIRKQAEENEESVDPGIAKCIEFVNKQVKDQAKKSSNDE